MPVCRFGRADRCRRLAELAAFGRDEGAKQTDYGLRAHLRVCWPGVIADGHLAPANLHDLTVADDLLADAHGWVLGDRSYWSPARAELLAAQDLWLVAPSRSARRPGPRLPRRLTQARRRVETVIANWSSATTPTGLGPRRLASVVTLATQAAQPHPGPLPLPADRPWLASVRQPPQQLNPHTGLATSP